LLDLDFLQLLFKLEVASLVTSGEYVTTKMVANSQYEYDYMTGFLAD